MNFNLYQAPEISPVFSIPITLIDGTSSMNRQYKYIIQAYEETFGDLLETQRKEYQWSINLKSIKPYLDEERGNLTMVLTQLFHFMLSNQFPTQYVTITLVTDGREPFDINSIMELCQQIKSKYTVQILCIAFGKKFPITLIKSLKESIENQDFKNQSLFQVMCSDYQCYIQIQKELKYAFQQIRQQLKMIPQNHILNFEVFTSIPFRQSQKYVESKELFLASSNQIMIIEDQQLVSINSPICILQFLRKSIQNIYCRSDLLQNDQIIQEFQQTFQFFSSLIKNVESREEYAQQLEIIDLILKIIEQIEFAYNNDNKKISLQQIEKFKDFIYCDDPKNLKEILDISKITKFEGLFKEIVSQVTTEFQILLNLDTYKNQNQIDFLKNYRTILTSSIKNIDLVFETIDPKNLEKIFLEFQNLIGLLIQLSREAFSSIYFDISTNEQYQQLIYINELLKNLQQLKTQTNLIQIKVLINQIAKLNLEQQNPIDPYFQFSYLQELQKNNSESISEKFLIFLIDKNEELKPYTDSILQNYTEIFSKISQKKRLEINWYNIPTTKFKIKSNQEFEQIEFQSFKLLLDSLKDKLQLKKKQIQLLILTDNEQSYEKLHLQIRFAQLSLYNFRIIYISIGMKILAYLESKISSNINQQSQNTQPYLKNIPKQLINNFANQEQIQQKRINHQKILQEIANYIDIQNF
ncbi:unnamed protein product [Paramecium primaurelia]|uniref:Uncharacterized protein n=1 Tax=Paramecium primaurelia TaxID=5886 RepID=A0A8S1K4J2_PARPR|nr:unnamed protein product [Paramecium primaurelia]